MSEHPPLWSQHPPDLSVPPLCGSGFPCHGDLLLSPSGDTGTGGWLATKDHRCWLGLSPSPHPALLRAPGQLRGHHKMPTPQQPRAESITDPASPYFGRIPWHGTTQEPGGPSPASKAGCRGPAAIAGGAPCAGGTTRHLSAVTVTAQRSRQMPAPLGAPGEQSCWVCI